MAINNAMAEVASSGNLPVPLHLRNAPTKLMKDLGYGKDYKYAHSYKGNFIPDNFFPETLKNKEFYIPGENQREKETREKLSFLWKDRYK